VAKECVEKGISAITIVTQGFADANDEEGKQLQKGLDKLEETSRALVFPTPEMALRALSYLADYSEFRVACQSL
jgi:hypothetical protein